MNNGDVQKEFGLIFDALAEVAIKSFVNGKFRGWIIDFYC